jgi:6-phosphogluconolactonase
MIKMNNQPEIEIVPDPPSLAKRALEEFLQLASETLPKKHKFTVALAGGSTPRQMYSLLAIQELDWSQVHIFWGDERCVSPDSPDSNYRMANEILLSHISLPDMNIHRIQGELPAEEAAREFETELNLCFNNELPHFDLVLLGLGGDGHTASLFPGTPALFEKKRWVSVVHHDVPPPPLVDRVTLTLPVINAAKRILFLVSGAEKAERLAKVLQGPYQPELQPAQAVKPKEGSLLWLMDKDAARLL